LPEALSAPALDSHCHLDLMDVDVATAVEQAVAVGITRIVTVGVDVPTSRWQVDTAVAHDSVYAAVAIHPNEVVNAADGAWTDIERLASLSGLPVVVKGVLTAEDARLACEHGASAIVVSNHGGRQLDGVSATIDALEEVVAAVAGRVEVLLDGGIRRGTDVVKALALGARAVLAGRAPLWGLAVDGEAGARQVLELLQAEILGALRLVGCTSAAEVTRDRVARK